MDPERKINTLTAYGAGGARILEREAVDNPGSNLDILIAFLRQHRDEDQPTRQVGMLEEIEHEINSLGSTPE